MSDQTPSPEQTAKEKRRLIELVRPELKEHGLVDLTDFIEKNGGEGFRHPGFVRSVAYRMEEMGVVEVIPRKEWTEFYIKRTIWNKRHPYWYAVKLSAIGIVFSIIAGISIAITQAIIKGELPPKKREESSTIKNLNDSTINLRQEQRISKDTLTALAR